MAEATDVTASATIDRGPRIGGRPKRREAHSTPRLHLSAHLRKAGTEVGAVADEATSSDLGTGMAELTDVTASATIDRGPKVATRLRHHPQMTPRPHHQAYLRLVATGAGSGVEDVSSAASSTGMA
jgi:hypothetical protein